uniref:Tim44-like domain-containing protein n=1 Tax=Strongyloides venezuelensis TaxID=75913 RepID=A0A0K0F8S2_STRVS
MTIQEVSKNVPKIVGTFLVNKPFVVAPSFELQRFVGNVFSQCLYQINVEKNFSKEGLINGANKAIISSAYCIKNQKWDAYSNVATKELVVNLTEEMNKKCNEERQMLEKLLDIASFEENIRKTIIFSTLFTGDKIFTMKEKSKIDFHAAFVSYIKNSDDPKNNYYCNIGVSRRVYPLGKWKITGVNFFDDKFATQF